jgi:hypothetical protein
MVFYLEADAAAVIKVGVCPLDNWVAGGADVSPPAWMASCFAAGDLNGAGALISFATGNGRYSAVADASMVQLLVDIGGTRNWGYYGELDGCKSDGVPADDRCFVAWDTPATFAASPAALFNRISPADDATVLVSMPLMTATSTKSYLADAANDGDNGFLGVVATGVAMVGFADAGSQHLAGRARFLLYAISAGALIQDSTRLGIGSIATRPGISIPWDSSAYPGAAAVTLSHSGTVAVPRDWIRPVGGGL